MFNAACTKVHDASVSEYRGQSMATTLVASVFCDRTVCVAHVGDSRSYFIRQKTIKRLTKDHVATALQVKLGLLLERQAMASPERSHLTRSVGVELTCQPDFTTQFLHHGDFILQASDGLHAYVLDEEIREIVAGNHPFDSCRKLVELAEKRGSDDNISIQLIEIRDWEKVAQVAAARAATLPPKPKETGKTAKLTPSNAQGELAPGMLLDNRFELTDLVARSNMASIFKANDRKTGESVALKLPLMALESDIAGFERFNREEEIGAALNHPSILKVIKVDGEKSRPYLVMEFLDGETLAQLLAKRKPLPEAEAISFAARICDALDYLHEMGIVHRDLKPQNIMVCRDGSLRLFDFGIARVEKARRLTFVGLSPTLGTPDYISPEQVKGKRGDHRSDIYSLGAILYEMVTGSTPFEGESPYVVMNARVTGDPPAPRSLNASISPALEEIILHALERDPRERYAKAGDMKRELENFDLVQNTSRFQRLRTPQPWKSGIRKWVLVGALFVSWILLFFLIILLSRHRR
jgi:serine/threonine-protein kinase